MAFFKKKNMDNDTLERYLLFKNQLKDVDVLSGTEEGVLITLDTSEPVFTVRKVLVRFSELNTLYENWETVNDHTFPSSLFNHFLHMEHKKLAIFEGI
jgi:hypothetical protein